MKHRELWYKHAVIYCLDVETFFDGNNDGVGDFPGLITRLDYLQSLGVTCLWLLPFYPTPNRDNGYDVMDYYGVDPRLGTLGDFTEFVYLARERGMRVLIDLVINHTSIEHPWFQAARKDKNSPYRDFYLWSKKKPKDADEGMVFPGVQKTTWTYDDAAGEYYFHRFYEHQPDLNISNPHLQEEIRRIIGFWLQLGVSGFRVDAAPFIIEMKGIDGAKETHQFDYLNDFRHFATWHRGDAILLAEANVEMKKIEQYYGDGDRLHMLFNFMLNQHVWLALAKQDARPIYKGIKKPPQITTRGQWSNFLRNHDELDLGRLSDKDREFVFDQFAPKKNMQLYERGIRRRLPPMLNGDRRRMEMAYSLMFSFPGTPVLWYGEEIGMGDDLDQKERNSVRTPMQWSSEKNGGFSQADKLIRPVISTGDFAYEKVNVLAQDRDDQSFLNWLRNLIATRNESPEFGYGTWEVIEVKAKSVFAHCCEWGGGKVIALHNLADEPVTVTLEDASGEMWFDLLHEHTPLKANPNVIELDGYGYRWFRVGRKG